jgi:hypothetical protein
MNISDALAHIQVVGILHPQAMLMMICWHGPYRGFNMVTFDEYALDSTHGTTEK